MTTYRCFCLTTDNRIIAGAHISAPDVRTAGRSRATIGRQRPAFTRLKYGLATRACFRQLGPAAELRISPEALFITPELASRYPRSVILPRMPARSFKAVDDLIRQAEEAATNELDPVGLVAELIRLAGDSGADPYVLVGTLVEGVANTLAKHIPSERRKETAAAMLKLLLERLNASEQG